MSKHFLLFVSSMFLFTSSAVLAQGLQGADFGPREIQGREQIPDLIPGKDDSARWLLFTNNASRLVGMRKSAVQKLFGEGAKRSPNDLIYQVTKPQPNKKIAFIELRIKLSQDIVTEYSIIGVWH